MKNTFAKLVALLALFAFSGVTVLGDGTELAVIVNTDNPMASMTTQELRRLIIGDETHWKNGKDIVLLMRTQGSAERNTLLRALNMDDAAYRKAWLAKINSGDVASAPAEVFTSGQAVSLVGGSPKSVAIVDASSVRTTVKVMRIDGHLPGESGYPLH
jgi:ABC-type phosphate transport system substrate-binding protein